MTAVAYLAGVLHGDGYCSDIAIGLTVKDKDFADAFAVALELATGSMTRPRREREYWRVTNRNDNGRFSHLKAFEPQTDEECGMWLRGLFDSEGNAQLIPLKKVSENSYQRRVSFYSTNQSTLERAQLYLDRLGIPATIRSIKLSEGHLGTKPVFELKLNHSETAFLRFAWLVGSNIARKRDILFALPLSYTADIGGLMRQAQQIGAQSKHRKTMEITLPLVVDSIRELIRNGVKPTQRNCRSIPGYNSVQRHVSQSELVEMALRSE